MVAGPRGESRTKKTARRGVDRSAASDSPPLVLLAEDNEAAAEVVRDILEAEGYRVVVACDGEEAVALAREHRPAVALMDVQMPRVDGLEAVRRIRATPGLSDLPIAVITALAMTGDRERCLAAGADAYFAKPISLRDLRQLVADLLARGRARPS